MILLDVYEHIRTRTLALESHVYNFYANNILIKQNWFVRFADIPKCVYKIRESIRVIMICDFLDSVSLFPPIDVYVRLLFFSQFLFSLSLTLSIHPSIHVSLNTIFVANINIRYISKSRMYMFSETVELCGDDRHGMSEIEEFHLCQLDANQMQTITESSLKNFAATRFLRPSLPIFPFFFSLNHPQFFYLYRPCRVLLMHNVYRSYKMMIK